MTASRSKALRIAPDLTLPLDAVTETFGILAVRGAGKRLWVETPIPTPEGWTKMGDLGVGSTVFDASGCPCRVTAVSAVGRGKTYRVVFSDGSDIIADAEHLWLTWDAHSRRMARKRVVNPNPKWSRRPQNRPQRDFRPAVRTTDEIRATLMHGRERNHAIRNTLPLTLPDAKLPIPPYVLGAWLGDGTSAAGSITTAKLDAAILQEIISEGYELVEYRQSRENIHLCGIRGLNRQLREAGLIKNKHVPREYLRGSVNQRLSLLQGLMDTDGGWSRCTAEFAVTNEHLADAVYELVVSLGMKATRSNRPAKLYGIQHGTSYKVSFTPTLPVFRLPRKLRCWRQDTSQQQRREYRYIEAVEPMDYVPMRCISVDSPSNLYLAGRAMVPTHNSNTAAVMAEEMFKAKLPFVVIDPARAWWGLRLARNGIDPGLPIPIFGGKRGDLPLDRTSGKLVADLVVDQRVTCVLDITEFPSEAAKKEFLTDFAKRLYDRNEEPLHLFLEEADDYIPQTPMHDEAVMLRAFENIVRRGRNRGIGCTLITQRSAAINKNVLTQVQTLIPMRTTGPQDIDAIERWLKYHRQNVKILESLSGLEDGEGWVWSPQFLKKVVRVKFRRRETYDSGRTPKVTDKARPSATLADINLGDIKKRMEATIQRVEQSDPRALQRKVAELQQQLALAKAMPPVKSLEEHVTKAVRTKIVRVAVPVLTKKKFYLLESRVLGMIEAFHKAANHVAVANMTLPDILQQFRRIVVTMQEGQADMMGANFESRHPRLDMKDVDRSIKKADELIQRFAPRAAPPVPEISSNGGGVKTAPRPIFLPRPPAPVHQAVPAGTTEGYKPVAGERAILVAMTRRHPQRMTRRDVGVWSGFHSGGSSFNTYFPRLKAAGLVAEEDGFIFPTQEGLYKGPRTPLAHQEIVALWNSKLKARGQRAMLTAILDHREMTRRQLGEVSGYAHSGSTFNTYLPVLKNRELVLEDHGNLTANPALWPEDLVR